MMRLMLDTNVLLDALLSREPWVEAATLLWKANDEGKIQGYIAASSFTDIFYIARKLADIESKRSNKVVSGLIRSMSSGSPSNRVGRFYAGCGF